MGPLNGRLALGVEETWKLWSPGVGNRDSARPLGWHVIIAGTEVTRPCYSVPHMFQILSRDGLI